ncbi:hypothetical protein [Bradyrhizobium sp. 45]|uniref:hypothetical protein n=1 Tax=Bradyrhizobium sp. 45 TaxID=1043587 RepID=UPI001FF79EB9|nr:hypothetical protein [Bradyrhizobium sp. 45]
MNGSQLTQGKHSFPSRRLNGAFYGAPVGILLLERVGRGGEFKRPFIPAASAMLALGA